MLTASMTFFVLAILGGLAMATLHFQGKKIPLALGLGHGALAAAGVFGVTALGGLCLISYSLRDRRLPTPLLFLHASLALLGFLLLLSVALTPP